MTDVSNVTDLIDAIRSANAENEERERLQNERAQRAEQLKLEADQAAAEAAALANVKRSGSSDLLRILRGLTSEVSEARRTAVTAVREGQDPVGVWTRYRLLRARNYGKWQAYQTLYARLSGNHRPPPGAWGPVMVPGQWDMDMGGQPEGFVAFLQAAVLEAEGAEILAGLTEASDVIEQADQAASPDGAA